MPAWTYYGSPVKLEEYGNELWPIVGGIGIGAAEEDWHWDLNPGAAATQCLFGTTRLGQRRTMESYFFF